MAKKSSSVTTFKIKSPANLINFLRRFSGIEKSLLLELTKTKMVAKSHTPERNAIKFSSMPIEQVLEGDLPAERMKIGIHNIDKVINVFKHFGEADEIFLDLRHDTIDDETIGMDMTFHSNKLEINLGCQDISLFTYVSAEALKRITDAIEKDKIIKFEFDKSLYSKINSLRSLDGAEDLLRIKISKGENRFVGKSFKYLINNDLDPAASVDIAINNKYFGYVDEEKSTFTISETKILIYAPECTTGIILASSE